MDPKNVQTGFAAMGRNLNGMKGWMFSQGFGDVQFATIYNQPSKVLQGMERQALIFKLFNSDSGIQSMHDQANNRIYSAYIALDQYISTNNVQRAGARGEIKIKFGPAFKSWYQELLTKTGSESYTWASGQLKTLNDATLEPCLERGRCSRRIHVPMR